MSVGFGLFKAVIRTGTKFSEISESGLSEAFFLGVERRAFEFLKEYYKNYGSYPEERTLAIEVGSEDCFDNLPSEPVTFWIDKVKHRYKFNQIADLSSRVEDLLRSDKVEDATLLLHQANANVLRASQTSQILNLSTVQMSVLEQHDMVQQCSEMPGIPMGIPYFDNVTGGLQAGDFDVIAGDTATGKTFLSLSIGLSANNSEKSVMFISTELPVKQVARRLLAMRMSLDSNLFKMGRLSYFARNRVEEVVRGTEGGAFFKLMPGGMFSNVDDIELLVMDHNPELVIVDGAYLLRTNLRATSRWERLMDIFERLKNITLKSEIPVLVTHQYNKQQSGSLEGLSGTQAISQLSSLVFSLEFEKKEDRNSTAMVQTRVLKLLKGRDGEAGKVLLNYNMNRTSITQNRVLSGFSASDFEETYDPDYLYEDGGDTFEVI